MEDGGFEIEEGGAEIDEGGAETEEGGTLDGTLELEGTTDTLGGAELTETELAEIELGTELGADETGAEELADETGGSDGQPPGMSGTLSAPFPIATRLLPSPQSADWAR